MRLHVCLALGLIACASEKRAPAAATPEARPAVVTPAPPPDAGPAVEPPPGRALTAGEIAMSQRYFGDAIDYGAVRVVPERFFALQPDGVYMTPNGNIYAPGWLFEADFSLAAVGPGRRAVFIHEMTHVWQHQSGINLFVGGAIEWLRQAGNYARAYPYALAAGLDLLEYGLEQQASIVEDQERLAIGLPPGGLSNRGLGVAARDALYGDVLRRLRADPGYARALPPAELHARLGRAQSFDQQ